MKVSVIVPVYNAGPYLEACVRSILGQSFSDFELLLVDDGSTDGSGAACDAWTQKDMRIHTIHQANAGAAAARNAGLDAAQGEWVAFVDSDDTLEPFALCHALDAAEAEGLDWVCYGYFMDFPDHSVKVGQDFAMLDAESLAAHISTFINLGGLGTTCNKLYRRDILEQHAIRFPVGQRVGEDAVFNCAYFPFAARIQMLSEPAYHYRKYGESTLDTARLDYDREGAAMIAAMRRAVAARGVEQAVGETLDYWETDVAYAHLMFLLKPGLTAKQRYHALQGLMRNTALRMRLEARLKSLADAKSKVLYVLVACRFAGGITLLAQIKNHGK
jgi:glycosyltransferase involved in cell wall biosynthesis